MTRGQAHVYILLGVVTKFRPRALPNPLVNDNNGIVDRGRQVWDFIDSIVWHTKAVENRFWQQRHPTYT